MAVIETWRRKVDHPGCLNYRQGIDERASANKRKHELEKTIEVESGIVAKSWFPFAHVRPEIFFNLPRGKSGTATLSTCVTSSRLANVTCREIFDRFTASKPFDVRFEPFEPNWYSLASCASDWRKYSNICRNFSGSLVLQNFFLCGLRARQLSMRFSQRRKIWDCLFSRPNLET